MRVDHGQQSCTSPDHKTISKKHYDSIMTRLGIVAFLLTVSCWKGTKRNGRVGLLESILFSCLQNSITVFLRIFHEVCKVLQALIDLSQTCSKQTIKIPCGLVFNLENASFYFTLISILVNYHIDSVTCHDLLIVILLLLPLVC